MCCTMPKLPTSTALVCRERGRGAREQSRPQKERQSPSCLSLHTEGRMGLKRLGSLDIMPTVFLLGLAVFHQQH